MWIKISTIEIEDTANVKDIRETIEGKSGIPEEEQRVIIRDRPHRSKIYSR